MRCECRQHGTGSAGMCEEDDDEDDEDNEDDDENDKDDDDGAVAHADSASSISFSLRALQTARVTTRSRTSRAWRM